MTEAMKVGRRRPMRSRNDGNEAAKRAVEDARERSKRQHGRGVQPLVLGAAPRADLLPTEVLVERRQHRVVLRMWGGVAVVAVVAAIGISGASLYASTEASDLADAQSQTLSLLQQQAQYKEVRTSEADASLLEAARVAAGHTEIDWGKTLEGVQQSLPAGVIISGVTVDSASPTEAYAQADAPLQGSRVATLTIDVVSPTLPSVPAWLDSVKALTGFVDATANSVTRDDQTGSYTVNMTIHVNEKAFDGKYALEKGK